MKERIGSQTSLSRPAPAPERALTTLAPTPHHVGRPLRYRGRPPPRGRPRPPGRRQQRPVLDLHRPLSHGRPLRPALRARVLPAHGGRSLPPGPAAGRAGKRRGREKAASGPSARTRLVAHPSPPHFFVRCPSSRAPARAWAPPPPACSPPTARPSWWRTWMEAKRKGSCARLRALEGGRRLSRATSQTRPSRPRASRRPWTRLEGPPSTSWSTTRVRAEKIEEGSGREREKRKGERERVAWKERAACLPLYKGRAFFS